MSFMSFPVTDGGHSTTHISATVHFHVEPTTTELQHSYATNGNDDDSHQGYSFLAK
jgi:hypothetical protein